MKTFVRIAVGIVVVLLVLYRVVDTAVTEDYSHEWWSASSAEAAANGILRARPVVPARSIEFQGRPVRVLDAWVEQATHVRYVAYLVETRVRDPHDRLVVRIARDTLRTEVSCDLALGYGDSLTFASTTLASRTLVGSDDEYFADDRVRRPFPDTLRLRVVRRREC